MMNRNAAFEITRLGENAPRISREKVLRPAAVAWLAAGAALVPTVPAAGFMGFTPAFYSLPDRMISTRRFLARPSAVALDATGLEAPYAWVLKRLSGKFAGAFRFSQSRTALGAPPPKSTFPLVRPL